MTNYEKLVEKLKEVEEIKKDLEELRFGSKFIFDTDATCTLVRVDTYPIDDGCSEELFGEWLIDDYNNYMGYKQNQELFYSRGEQQTEKGYLGYLNEDDIIGNSLEERHLRMYCAEYNIRCTFKNIFFEEEEKSASLLFLKGKQIVELDNTKHFHLQNDKVYGEILDYLNNI